MSSGGEIYDGIDDPITGRGRTTSTAWMIADSGASPSGGGARDIRGECWHTRGEGCERGGVDTADRGVGQRQKTRNIGKRLTQKKRHAPQLKKKWNENQGVV